MTARALARALALAVLSWGAVGLCTYVVILGAFAIVRAVLA